MSLGKGQTALNVKERKSLNTSSRNAAETVWCFFLTHCRHADCVCKAALFNITCFSGAGVSIRRRHVTCESFWKKTGDKTAWTMLKEKSTLTLCEYKTLVIDGVKHHICSLAFWVRGPEKRFPSLQLKQTVSVSVEIQICGAKRAEEVVETGRTVQYLSLCRVSRSQMRVWCFRGSVEAQTGLHKLNISRAELVVRGFWSCTNR